MPPVLANPVDTGKILRNGRRQPIIERLDKKGSGMDYGIAGKKAFVSGSSSGIGSAIAIALAKEGCNVIVHGRDKARTEDIAHQVEALGVKAAVTMGDLATEAGCKDVSSAIANAGGIDILVNNAGVALSKDDPVWYEIPYQTWLDSYEVNFMSTLRMSQMLLPGLKEKGWGRIVNITTGGAIGTPILTEYGAAKAALNKLTADMAKTIGKFGITVNAIAPGVIKSPAVDEWMIIQSKKKGWPIEEFEKRWIAERGIQAVERFGRPEDIANATVFFASQQAEFISGVIMAVNGGGNRTVYL